MVDVGVNTHKNAQHSAPLAPHVENEIHSKTKLATQKGQEEVNQKSDFSDTSSNECFIITSRSKKRLAKAFKRPAPSSYTASKLLLSQIPAQTNIMDEYQFRKLQTERPEMALQESSVKLKALNHDLTVNLKTQ